jgi:hypothetical protein
MSFTEITSFEDEFISRVKENLPKEFNIKDLTVLSNGLVLMPNSTTQKQGYRPLGCPECLGVKVSQNSEGYPAIGNKKLLTPEEANHPINNISPELVTNLWLCPNCKIPISALLPEFDLSAL